MKQLNLSFHLKKVNDHNWIIKKGLLSFWKEILSQIVLPLLEDIHLAVEIPNKNTDNEFFKHTIQDILEKLNLFMLN